MKRIGYTNKQKAVCNKTSEQPSKIFSKLKNIFILVYSINKLFFLLILK